MVVSPVSPQFTFVLTLAFTIAALALLSDLLGTKTEVAGGSDLRKSTIGIVSVT
jgi:hypothetical protein